VYGKLLRRAEIVALQEKERAYSVPVILGTTPFANMFGLSAEDALPTQLALFGLSGEKK
jgi:hypothetical protein